MKIKFADLSKIHSLIKHKLLKSFNISLKNSNFIGGKNVSRFEKNFARRNKVKYCTSVANGTDALFITLKSLKIKPGDEIIVPAHSWISTSEAVTLAGAKVKFCDVSKKTFNIDDNQIEKNISKRTIGIIAVHLYGNPANMLNIMKIAKKNKLWVVEDCAQAHFAKINNKYIGSFGDMAAFSFYPGKNLGALGDGGAILTNNKKLFDFAYKFSRHGSRVKHNHEFEGMNSRLDAIQAEFLNIKLLHYSKVQKIREYNSKLYNEKINNKYIQKPFINKKFKHVYHQYVIKSKYRDKLRKYLSNFGIETRILYPYSLPFLKAYKDKHFTKNHFPNAYENQTQILSLPNDPSITRKQILYIINKINYFKI